MTEQELIRRIKEIQDDRTLDTEGAHGAADDLLLEFLKAIHYDQAAEAWEDLREEADFWYA